MAAETAAPATGGAGGEPNHGLRIGLIWLVLAAAVDLVYWFVLGPNVPPGHLGSAAQGQQFDINVMSVMCIPVVAFVVVYFGYSLIVWRHRDGDDEDGPPIHGHAGIQTVWITLTSVIVLSLFGFGYYELAVPAGAGPARAPRRSGTRRGRG